MRRAVMSALVLLTVVACQKQAPQQDAQGGTLHDTMVGTIDPNADILWQTSAKGLDERGYPKAGLLTEAHWQAMARAAVDLGKGADMLVQGDRITVVAPGVRIKDEGIKGAATGALVQQRIKAAPQDLRNHALALRQIAAQFSDAIDARDVARLSAASDRMDQVCEACHIQFWYPDQKPAY